MADIKKKYILPLCDQIKVDAYTKDWRGKEKTLNDNESFLSDFSEETKQEILENGYSFMMHMPWYYYTYTNTYYQELLEMLSHEEAMECRGALAVINQFKKCDLFDDDIPF